MRMKTHKYFYRVRFSEKTWRKLHQLSALDLVVAYTMNESLTSVPNTTVVHRRYPAQPPTTIVNVFYEDHKETGWWRTRYIDIYVCARGKHGCFTMRMYIGLYGRLIFVSISCPTISWCHKDGEHCGNGPSLHRNYREGWWRSIKTRNLR